ncbi:MAG: prepilin-type N-terminal cleavage/methylation domain-containing protein [Nitrospirae bacterium]|nr:prepilin-type N-terminal cleavage/methylation domain-containing protein [Nitrospirota bacterium]
MHNKKGFTLTELIIVVAIIGILAAIAVPSYLGQQKRAARAEAYTNLESLRLLEEQFMAENSAYTASVGTCSAGNDNITAIQALLPGFQPGSGLNFSYCIEQNIVLAGTAQTPCFRASAFGNSGTRVSGDTFRIDCTNNKNY